MNDVFYLQNFFLSDIRFKAVKNMTRDANQEVKSIKKNSQLYQRLHLSLIISTILTRDVSVL